MFMSLVPAKTEKQIKGGPLGAHYKNLEKSTKMIDDALPDAIQVLVDGLSDKDKYYRFNCACTIIKKAIPDKKRKEITGVGGKPIEIKTVDRRESIISIIGILDELDIDELKEQADNGSFRLSEFEPGSITEAEIEMEREAEPNQERGEPEPSTSPEQSVKSPVFAKKKLRKRFERKPRR